jgi:hypothetical protein
MSDRVLLRVTAPHFTAGIAFDGDRGTAAAPILGWAVRKRLPRDRFIAWCRAKHYAIDTLPDPVAGSAPTQGVSR